MSGIHVEVTSVGAESHRLELTSASLLELAGLVSNAIDMPGATGGGPAEPALAEFSTLIASMLVMIAEGLHALSGAVHTAGESYLTVDSAVMQP